MLYMYKDMATIAGNQIYEMLVFNLGRRPASASFIERPICTHNYNLASSLFSTHLFI